MATVDDKPFATEVKAASEGEAYLRSVGARLYRATDQGDVYRSSVAWFKVVVLRGGKLRIEAYRQCPACAR